MDCARVLCMKIKHVVIAINEMIFLLIGVLVNGYQPSKIIRGSNGLR